MRIVLDLTPSRAPDKRQGQVYNADAVRTYSGYLTMTGANALEPKCSVIGDPICKSEPWTRAR